MQANLIPHKYNIKTTCRLNHSIVFYASLINIAITCSTLHWYGHTDPLILAGS